MGGGLRRKSCCCWDAFLKGDYGLSVVDGWKGQEIMLVL